MSDLLQRTITAAHTLDHIRAKEGWAVTDQWERNLTRALLSRARCRASRQILHHSEQLMGTVRFLSDGLLESPVLKPGFLP